MEQMRQQSAQKKKLKQYLRGRGKTFRLGRRKDLEKEKNREGKVTKNVKHLSKLKKEIDDNTIQSIRNLYKLKKENEATKHRKMSDIKEIFEQEKES